MSTNISSHYSLNPSDYVLATGARAVGRLLMLDDIYAPAGKRGLLKAGLKAGMHVADFGCGVGAMTRNLAEMVGPNGRATGIDIHGPQLVEAANQCARWNFVQMSRSLRSCLLVCIYSTNLHARLGLRMERGGALS